MALVLVIVTLGIFLRGIPETIDIDSYSYQKMARGEIREVVQPYANRVLHPLTVRAIASLGIENDGWVFAGVGVLAFFIFVFAVVCLIGERVSGWDVFALLASPVLCLYCINIYLPDLLFLALWGLLLLAMRRDQILPSAILLFLMQLTRESTLAVVAVIVVVAIWKRQWRWVFAAGTALVCAMMAVSWLARDAQPNIHGMGGLVYMGSKVVGNVLANILGVTPWTDSYARQLPWFYPDLPVWKTTLPAWVPLGGVKEIGIYKLHPIAPVQTLTVLLATFGILPALLVRYWKRMGWRQVVQLPFPILVPLVSGILFYFLGVVTGRSADRLVGYGWPAFWIALPVLCLPLANKTKLWSAHLACQWLPILVSRAAFTGREIVCLFIVVPCYLYAWKQTK